MSKQVWPIVVKDMLERNEEGAVKYNRYLRTDCLDNMLQHAYEEALDLCVYLKTQIEKEKNKDVYQYGWNDPRLMTQGELQADYYKHCKPGQWVPVTEKQYKDLTNGCIEVSGMDSKHGGLSTGRGTRL